jgi:UDP-N-acetylmuramate: L-alanyl-gamma-D-glutamyl-meso-diaminopimelate ligase
MGVGEWQAANLKSADGGMAFDVVRHGEPIGQFSIPMLGTFNVQNALHCIVVCKELGMENADIQKGLSTFKSVKRRLEVRGEVDGVRVYDDFAHHPTAVAETLKAVRQRFPGDRIWAVFEPRSQTCRRRVFEQAFIESFDPADEVVIARVFGASKLPPEETLSPDRVVEGVRGRGKKATTFDSTDEIVSYIGQNAKRGDHVVIMSNGGFDGIHNRLLERLKAR